MRKLNKKGFTLIELLAVIVIMGILMVVAIPAISRTIENSRRGTFANTVGNYINSVKNAYLAEYIQCYRNTTGTTYVLTPASAMPLDYTLYVPVASNGTATMYTDYDDSYVGISQSGPETGSATLISIAKGNFDELVESGGKSPFANSDVLGYVRITKEEVTAGKIKANYTALIRDNAGNGPDSLPASEEEAKTRTSIKVGNHKTTFAADALPTNYAWCKYVA